MSPETFDTLIDSIEAGNTLKQAIRDARTSWRALSLLLEKDDAAASRYARARSVSAHFYADRAQEAVEQALTKDDAQLAKVRADVYRWRAGVANPKEYGDRVQHDTTVTIGTLHLDALRQRTVGVRATLSQAEAPQLLTPATPDDAGGDVTPEAD